MLLLPALLRRIAPALVFAAIFALAAEARAASFGADLTLPANGTRTCAQGLYPDPLMATWMGVDFGSCTWWSAGSLTPGQGDALVPRGGGVLKRVRVKVGPVTGRMRVLVLRQRRHPLVGTAACCFYVASTPVFTPAANGITEIETDIPVVNAYDPASGLENFDLIALSSLDRGVPVPAWIGGSGYSGGAIGGVFPHWEPPTEQRPDYGTVTFGQVLISGDVEAAPETGGGGGGGGVAAAPTVNVDAKRPAPVTGNRRAAKLTLSCGPAAPCEGTIRLTNRGGAVEYGRAAYSLAAGDRERVRVALKPRAQRKLRTARKLVAYATLTPSNQRVRVTLSRA
jgi:hypothetical protein